MSSFERGTTTRLSLSRFTKKFSFRNKEYSKVEDSYDTRIPLHNEDAFQYGLRFKAKYIGSLEIARPTSKIDIITAMRRIRYEYKVKGVRKKRCYIEMSVSGVKISRRKSKRSRKKYTEEQLFIMQHPIYRIFYVSHDSQDMKIFSYITREVPDNTFRCNVFKAYKKRMALHVVRSLGQAFDICHKLNPKPAKKKEESEAEKGKAGDAAEGEEGEETTKSPTGVPSHWKTFNTDIDSAMEKLSLEEGGGGDAGKEKPSGSDDLLGLNFDPFITPAAPADAFAPNGSLVDPFQSSFTSGGDSSAVAYPPLTVSNLSTNLPDFPDGVDPASITVPPPHMAYFAIGGQRPPGFAAERQQTTIAENPFTSAVGREESPISIGEALTTVPEDKVVSGHQRNSSNPFKPTEEGSAWEVEKKQFMSEMALMREQLKSETVARLESQARVEHLLNQNKELINHLQKLMVQLQQLQSLGLQQQQQSPQQQQPPPTMTTPPPKNSTPTQDKPASSASSRGGGTPVAGAASAPSPPREPSPIQAATATSSSTPVKSSSPTSDGGDAVILPTLTSTPSPTPAQTSAELGSGEGGRESVEEVATTLPEVGGAGTTDLKLDTSDLSGLGSLDIDVELMTTSTLPDDPFAPLPNTSVQLTSS